MTYPPAPFRPSAWEGGTSLREIEAFGIRHGLQVESPLPTPRDGRGPGVRFLDDLDRIEQQLVEARDALVTYWEQPEGQACFLALGIANDALSDYYMLDKRSVRERNSANWRRIETIADEILRLRAPLEG